MLPLANICTWNVNGLSEIGTGNYNAGDRERVRRDF